MVDLYVYDNSLRAVGIADKLTEVLWERRFYEAGFFQIKAPFTANNNELLKTGNFLLRADAAEGGVIRYTQRVKNAENAEITAVGRFLSYLLQGHVIRRRVTVKGNAEAAMRGLVEAAVMNRESPEYIPEIELAEAAGCSGEVPATTASYRDLHDALKEISRLSGTGFRLTLDPNRKKMVFSCYDGIDRSAGQSVNTRVIFSPMYDSVLSDPTYTEDDSETVNAVIGQYYGAYGEMAVEYNPKGLTGRALREAVFESDCVTTDTPDGPAMDVSATRAKLMNEAVTYISAPKRDFSAGVASSGMYRYRENYDIGDIVTVGEADFGVQADRRIHKITENFTAAGREVIPTFGEIDPAEVG